MTKRRRFSSVLAFAALLAAVMGAMAPGAAQVQTESASAGPVPAGVVLWNRLGSWWEARNSVVGPNGTIAGGSFVPGVFGNAYRAEHDQDFKVKFWPGYLLNRTSGTIEFWGRISGFTNTIEGGGGSQPMFVQLNDTQAGVGYYIFLTANDGAGGGGLSGFAGHNETASGGFDRWTYGEVLGPNVEGWHHYALVWKQGGIPGVDDGTRQVTVFLDGVLESGYWDAALDRTFPWFGNVALKVGSIDRVEQGAVEVDNLIVWNCAVTDFSGRFVQKPTFHTCAR